MEIENSSYKRNIEEWYGVIVSFIYYFSILSAYYVVRPIRDQLAVELGSDKLPWLFGATFIVTLITTPLFSWIVSKWKRRIVMPVVNLFFVICLAGFIFLFHDKSMISIEKLGVMFFVWVSIFNLFIVSVFWSFMSDIWDDSQAYRFFPIIALGGTLGAITGPMITRNLVEMFGLTFLLAISASLLLIAILCILVLGNWARNHGKRRLELNSESALQGGMLDGLKQIFSNYFIGTISIVMLLNDAIGTIAYVLITDYSGITFSHDVIAQTKFAANMDLAANVIQVFVQLAITRWLLTRYGASVVFFVWAIVMVAVSSMMVISGNPYAIVIGSFPFVAIVQILTRSLSYGMLQPAQESLYTLVPRELRYKGKNAVDTMVWRAGDVISVSFVNILRGFGMPVIGFGMIWTVLAALSGFVGFRLAQRVENQKKD